MTVLFVLFIVTALHKPLGASLALGGFVLLLYIPMGYFMDQQFYRRYQQREGRTDTKR